jgi:uncharacterized protein
MPASTVSLQIRSLRGTITRAEEAAPSSAFMTPSKAIIWAAKRGDRVALRKAIDAGADLNTTDVSGWTPLFHAAGRGDVQAMKLLIQAGADVNHGADRNFTPLFAAILGNHLEAIQTLLATGAHVHTSGGDDLSRYVQDRSSEKGQKIMACLENAKAQEGRGPE